MSARVYLESPKYNIVTIVQCSAFWASGSDPTGGGG